MIQCQRTPVVTLWGPGPSPCREGRERVLPIVCLFLSYPVVSLRPCGSLPDREAGRKSPSQNREDSLRGEPLRDTRSQDLPGSSREKTPGRKRVTRTEGPERAGSAPGRPDPYCTGFFDKITAETAGRKQDSRGEAVRERRESGRGKKKDWRALLFFRPLLAPSGTVPGRPRHSLLLGERMRRPGPIPGVGGHQTKSLGQERREGRSRVVATGGLPALKRSCAGKGPTSRRRDLDLPDPDPATDWTKAPIPRSSPRRVTLSASGDTLARPRNNEDGGGISCLTPWWGERARKNPVPMAPGPDPLPLRPPGLPPPVPALSRPGSARISPLPGEGAAGPRRPKRSPPILPGPAMTLPAPFSS